MQGAAELGGGSDGWVMPAGCGPSARETESERPQRDIAMAPPCADPGTRNPAAGHDRGMDEETTAPDQSPSRAPSRASAALRLAGHREISADDTTFRPGPDLGSRSASLRLQLFTTPPRTAPGRRRPRRRVRATGSRAGTRTAHDAIPTMRSPSWSRHDARTSPSRNWSATSSDTLSPQTPRRGNAKCSKACSISATPFSPTAKATASTGSTVPRRSWTPGPARHAVVLVHRWPDTSDR